MDATTLPAAAATDTPMVINCVAYSADGRRLRDITIEEISDVIATPDPTERPPARWPAGLDGEAHVVRHR